MNFDDTDRDFRVEIATTPLRSAHYDLPRHHQNDLFMKFVSTT